MMLHITKSLSCLLFVYFKIACAFLKTDVRGVERGLLCFLFLLLFRVGVFVKSLFFHDLFI